MDDRTIMDNILSVTKGACDLMMHGAIESSTPNVHAKFKQAFDEVLCMQTEIYSKMSEKGWYPMEQAPQQQITQAKQKYSQTM